MTDELLIQYLQEVRDLIDGHRLSKLRGTIKDYEIKKIIIDENGIEGDVDIFPHGHTDSIKLDFKAKDLL